MLFRRALQPVMERRSYPDEVALNDPALLQMLGIDPEALPLHGKNVLREATAHACIKIISEALGKLPWKVYREGGKGSRKETAHPLYQLLKLRPNPYMSAAVLMRTVEVQRLIYGNAYIAPEFDYAGRIVGLYPVDATKVEIWVDDVGLLSGKNQVWYVVTVGSEKRRLHSDELVHLKALTTDGIVGIAPLQYLKHLAENGSNATEFIHRFFKQGLGVKGIVHYVGDLSEEAKRNFRDKFESMAAGLNNWHRTALLPVGFQFQPVSMSMVDAQFLENTEFTVRQIASAFGVKMHQLGDLSRSTHTNIEQQQKQFWADTLQSIIVDYEQEMTYKLLLDSEIAAGYYVKCNVDSIVRSDIKTRYEAYRIGVQGGFLRPNEVRALEELPPADGGDQLLVNGSMVPITDAGKHYKGGGDAGNQTDESDPDDAGDPNADRSGVPGEQE